MRRALMSLVGLVALTGCFALSSWRPEIHEPGAAEAFLSEGPYLKVHMNSGELYVLDEWSQPTPEGRFNGGGWHYDGDRTLLRQGAGWSFEPDQIALLETNQHESVSRFAYSGLVVYTLASGSITAICLSDAKGCFGSCPTFYGDDPDRPLAEGFSSSFARALEARDLDDLRVTARPGAYSLLMRNEALETHAIRHVRLTPVPLGEGEAVIAGVDAALYGATDARAPIGCAAADGDCLAQVRSQDDVEYTPLSDPTDLGAREEIVLDFEARTGALGVLLEARQSLVSTFLFYQALAYAGTGTGELLASIERGEGWAREAATAVPDALGNIEVAVQEGGGEWRPVGVFDEAGPIAVDSRAFPFAATGEGGLRVRLRMARGAWRVDRVAVAELSPKTPGSTLEPDSITASAGADEIERARAAGSLARLADPEAYLVTTPGSALRLWFTVPPGAERYALFLDTQGYYYEWMRAGWLPEEDPLAVRMMSLAPEEALRALAPAFKALEPTMEELFWSSRFRRDR